MSDKPMTLIERLRNPAFEDGGALNIEQTRKAMDEAADTLGALMAIIKMANVDRT